MTEKTIRIDGPLNIRNGAEWRERFAGELATEGDLVLDLAGLEECDTAGLQLLCSLRRTAAAGGRRVRIGGLPRVLEAMAGELGVALEEFSEAPGGGGGL